MSDLDQGKSVVVCGMSESSSGMGRVEIVEVMAGRWARTMFFAI
jgi:hypothetical protein